MSAESTARAWPAAAVQIRLDGQWYPPRPGVLVFDTPTGWAWLEPSYADPLGAATPALHERTGQPQLEAADLLQWTGPDGELIELTPFDPVVDYEIADAIAWWEAYLQAAGRSQADEREQLREQLRLSGVVA